MGYIYKIRNSVNDKIYVGKTTRSVSQRWEDHIKELHRPRKYASKLYRAMSKYGEDKFFIETIEECDNALLDERERYWIRFYNTTEKGYNITIGGDGHNVIDDNEKMYLLTLWNCGLMMNEIEKRTGRNHKAISRILYENGVTKDEINARQAKISRNSNGKTVYVYDLKGRYLKSYHSVAEASEDTGIRSDTISKVALNNSRNHSANGLIFRYYMKNDISNELPDIPNQPKRVRCIETGEVFPTLTKAGEFMGVTRHTIKAHILKEQPLCNYHFEYAE